MKNFIEARGAIRQLRFDPLRKEFVLRNLPHPFVWPLDTLEQHMLRDLGIDAQGLEYGVVRFSSGLEAPC